LQKKEKRSINKQFKKNKTTYKMLSIEKKKFEDEFIRDIILYTIYPDIEKQNIDADFKYRVTLDELEEKN
jgi:hypothetical protein